MSPSRADDAPDRVRVVGSGAVDPDPDEDLDPVDDVRTDRVRLPVLTIILAVVALAGVFGTVFFGLKYRAGTQQDDAQKAVTQTSRAFLLALFNFDANTIDGDFNRIQSFATGDFETQALTFFSSDVRQALAKVQAQSRGQIRSLFVQNVQGDQATTFADVDQTIANLDFKQPESDEVLISLTLKKLPQGWRISEVTVVQAPSVASPSNPVVPPTTAPAPAPATTAPAASTTAPSP